MKIPKKIKVLAREYTIEIVDSINEQDHLGETKHSKLNIKIKRSHPLQMEQTLLHELFHCIAGTFTEYEVDTLANSLHSLIKDNPGMFKELSKT